jgi:uncharacterized protein (DUF983 family)
MTRQSEPHRDLRQAMWCGFRNRCPKCGEGKLFRAFLKPVPACTQCGEAYDGLHRVDDFATYVVMFIVGHLVVPLFLFTDRDVLWPIWIHMVLWPGLVLLLSLVLIQPVKGALIAQQWAMRLHGFGPDETEAGNPTKIAAPTHHA